MEDHCSKPQADGPCFTCKHVTNQITHGVCTKIERHPRVAAMGGCLDYGTTVYYEFDSRLNGLFEDPNKEKQDASTQPSERGREVRQPD